MLKPRSSILIALNCLGLSVAATCAWATPLTLTGSYLQVGISDYGTFGSNGSTEPGLLHDPTGTGNFYPGGIANDYLTPGSPHDGFAINSTETGFIVNDNTGTSTFGMTSPTLLTGAAANGYANAATWTGTYGSALTITNNYFFNNGDEQVKVVSTITALEDLTNVAFGRSEDPDPDEYRYSSYSTINTRGDSATAPQDIVSGAGAETGLTIGILNQSGSTYPHNTDISTDCCSNEDPYTVLSSTSTVAYPTTNTGDYGLQIAWSLGNLVSGESESVDYNYVFGTHQSTVSAGTSSTIDTTDGDVSPNTFSLGSAAATANPVVFDGGTLQMSGGAFPNNIITAPVTIDATNGTIDTSTGSGGFSGVVSGPGSLTIGGGGTFSLTGANTYSGGTVLNAGTLAAGNDAALGTGTLTINGGTLQAAVDGLTIANAAVLAGNGTVDTQAFGLTYAGAISGTGQLTKVGTGKLALTAANSYAGGTALNDGTIAIGDNVALGTGTLTFGGGMLQAAADGLTLSNAAVLASNGTIDTQGFGFTVSSVVSGPGALTKVGTGTLTLMAANSYAGGTALNDGTIAIGDNAALGTGTLTFGGGMLQAAADGLTLSNAAVLASNGTIDTQGFGFTVSGVVSGPGALTKVGTGTLTLTAANTYAGGTALNDGTIAIGDNAALGTGTLTFGGGMLQAAADGLTLSNAAVLASNGTIDTQGFGFTVSSVVSGPGALTKVGTGKLVLTAANTYAGGTALNDGTIAIGTSAALGTGTLTFGGGMLQAAADGLTLSNAAVLASNGTIDTQGFGFTVSGVVSGPGVLTKVGTGKLALTAANTYAGGTALNDGTIAIGTSAALGTGTLTFGGGMLQAAAAGLTLSNAAVLASNGTIDTQAFTLVYGGLIAGTGSLTKVGTGTLALTGANTFAGGTVLTGGTVIVSNATTSGTTTSSSSIGSGTLIFNGGTLQAAPSTPAPGLTFANRLQVNTAGGTIDANGVNINLTGPITDGTGAGQLVFANSAGLNTSGSTSGVTTLSGANTFSGGSVISAGAFVILGANNALGSGKLDVEGGLELGTSSQAVTQLTGRGVIFNNAGFAGGQGTVNVLTVQGGNFQGTISDNLPQTIQLVKASDGTASGGILALTGSSSYGGGTVLKAGTIAIGSSTALGTGALQMADGTTLQFLADGLTLANAIVFTGTGDPTFDTGSGSETVSGPISGSSSLTKIGSGTLDLTGTDTYTGATTVEAGTLVVDGSIANSTVTVDSGAALGGGGTIGGLIVQGGSVVAPGARTLTINGNLTFAAGSTYQATINADGTSSRLAVGGTASLGGAALSLVTGTGTFGNTTKATLLTAAGGVSGTFAAPSADQTLAFLNPAVTYTPTSVNLALTRNTTTLPSVAATPNQTAVATAIAALGPSSPLYNAVIGQTAAGARQAFDATSGLSHSSTERITATTTRLLTGLVVDRLSDVSGNGLSAQQVVDQFGTQGGLPALVRCYDAVPTSQPSKPQSYTAWGEAFGTFGHTDGGANYGTLDRSVGGFILGIDTPLSGVGIDQWRAGVAGGYSETFYTSHLDSGTGTVQSVYGSLYGGARYGSVDIKVGTTISDQQTDAQRAVAFPNFFETEKSSNGGLTEQGFGEIGYRIPISHVVIEPVVAAAILHVHQDGFREAGGIAALVAGATDSTVGTTTLGVRGEMAPIQGLPVIAHAFLGWQHLIGNASPATTLAFESAAGNTFSISGTPLDRDALAAEFALDYRATAALDVGLTYSGTIGPTADDHSIKGRAEYRF